MFDKIFKIILLLILGFTSYAIYLNSQKDRYYLKDYQVILDKQTGQLYQTPFSGTEVQEKLPKLSN